jgi:alpha-galactosidase
VSTKITFIGGGSYQWTPTLLLDIAQTPVLADAEIALCDIDPAPLPRMLELVDHINELAGTKLSATATTDQRAALPGSDYVVVCISTGALQTMAIDLDVPERYGIKQSVGDTVGPGGINRALRNIPVLVGVARDMEELCPDAWLLNLTNPMTTLTRSITSATDIETIGLCHEVTITQFTLSLLLDCDMRAIDIEVCGVNHLPIITKVSADGRDGLAELADKLDDPEAFGSETLHLPPGIGHEAISFGGDFTKAGLLDQHKVKLELFRRFGVLPGAGDRHLVEFFPGFLTEQSGWGARWGVKLTPISERETWQSFFISQLEKHLASESLPTRSSGEIVAPIIDSRIRNKTRAYPINVPNAGQCPDIPEDAVVEGMGLVDAEGVRPRDVVSAPPLLAEYIRRVSASQELTVEAALAGDRDLVFQAMLADPLASRIDYDDVWRMTNELIDATAPWLPQFAAP